MRPDLNKLLCERERRGSSTKYHQIRHKRVKKRDELPHHEGMSAPHKWGREFSENLNPLWGWVRKNVGRRWDHAYSELCQVFDKRSVINQHILTHLFQDVEIHTLQGDDGKLYIRENYFYGIRQLAESTCEYYVHPITNILMENKRRHNWRSVRAKERRAAVAEKLKTERVIDAETKLFRADETAAWFIERTKTIDGVLRTKWVMGQGFNLGKMIPIQYYHYPEIRDGLYRYDSPSQFSPTYTYVYERKQASKKELKQYGVQS